MEFLFRELKDQLRTGWDAVQTRTIMDLDAVLYLLQKNETKLSTKTFARVRVVRNALDQSRYSVLGTGRPPQPGTLLRDEEFECLSGMASTVFADIRACARIFARRYRERLREFLRNPFRLP